MVQYAFKHGRRQRKKKTVAVDYQKSAKAFYYKLKAILKL